VLKIEIEEISAQVPIEISMETQKIEKEPKVSYNAIHYGLLLFVFLQVCWYITFSEPLTVLWGGEPLLSIYNDDLISRTARIVMIYHSLSVPFLIANTFWIMEVFEVRKKWVPTLKILLVPSAFIVGINGMLFAYTNFRLFHELYVFGLFLTFLGGIVYIIAAFPIPGKFPDPESNPRGSTVRGLNLEYYNCVVLAICILISVTYGALAAMENFTGTLFGLGRDPVAFLPEALMRYHHHDVIEGYIVSHLHIQLAQSAAMVVLVGFRTSKTSGTVYTLTLLLFPVGVLVLSFGAWIINHYIIWGGAGVLLVCTAIMTIFGWKNVSKDMLGEKYESASRFEKIKGMFKDPVRFTYYFVFFYSFFVVTISGIIIGLQVDEVYRTYPYAYLEYIFNVGHWHVLSVLIAVILVLLSFDHFNVQGRQRKILGWVFFIGATLAFLGADIYMLRPLPAGEILYDRTEILLSEPGLIIAFIGVYFLFFGFIMGIIVLTKKFREYRREVKLAKF